MIKNINYFEVVFLRGTSNIITIKPIDIPNEDGLRLVDLSLDMSKTEVEKEPKLLLKPKDES